MGINESTQNDQVQRKKTFLSGSICSSVNTNFTLDENVLNLSQLSSHTNICNKSDEFPQYNITPVNYEYLNEDDLIKRELLDYQNSLKDFKSKILKKQKHSLSNFHRKTKNSNENEINNLIKEEKEKKKEEVEYSYDRKRNLIGSFKTQRYSLKIFNNNGDYFLSYEYRKGDELRRSYISKLMASRIWSPNKNRGNNKNNKPNGIIIFDWDDTLLCTSFLTPNGFLNECYGFTDEEKETLEILEEKVMKLLKKSIDKGDTYIITNSQPGWVEYTARKFYPSLDNILNKINIISARGEYELQYPGDLRMWKIKSFLDILKRIDGSVITNILCIGDSFIEIEAAKIFASYFSEAYIKSIKFRESPHPKELIKQLELVEENFSKIFIQAKNLNISVKMKS